VSSRTLSPEAVDRIVKRAIAVNASRNVLQQARRALAVLRADGYESLSELLKRDLPDAMVNASEWRTFRTQLGSAISQVYASDGQPGVELLLAWLGRRAVIEQKRAPKSGDRRPDPRFRR
jgi:hypothetical protein